MNSEKQITITDIKGKFNKDFDTFGKMDPFLEFYVGKCFIRTETHDGGGKEPTWKNQVVLTYFDEPIILIKSYDEDATEKEFIGSSKIQIKSLRFPGGALQANVLTDSGQIIGSLTAKYTIKNLPAVPLLIIKNIKCDFVKEHSFITKTKPYLEFKTEEGSIISDQKEEPKGLVLSWNETLRLRIKENSKINIHLLDKNEKQNQIFKYDCSAKEFKCQNGSKRFNVFDQKYSMIGALQFDYQTVNLVSKEESVKNLEKEKKSESQLTSIFIQKAKLDLMVSDKDMYMRLIVGSNFITTDLMKNISKQSSIDIKKIIYAEAKQNKLIVLIWQKDILKDKIIGVATIPLEGLTSGDKKVTFMDLEQKGEVGTGFLSVVTKQVSLKVLTIDAIAVSFVEGGDFLGQSQPYVVARIGGWQGRTETGDQNRISFKKNIEIKFNDEQSLQLQVWDQDVTNDEIIYSEKVNLSEFKAQKGQMSIPLNLKENDKLLKKGKVSFKYQLKINTIHNETARKASERKMTDIKVQPKSQEPKSPQALEKKIKNKSQVKQPSERSNVQIPKKITVKQQKSETIVSQRKNKTIEEPVQLSKRDIKQSVIVNDSHDLSTNLQNQRQERLNTHHSLNKNSISKSKETFNLPSIVSSHINYGDRIFDKQSAATLQKTILVYSMPKAPRFINEPKYTGQPSYCLDSCFKSSSSKGVGFGYGRKKQFPDWMERNMKQNPPPGAYFENNSDVRSKGPTFGISHKHYQKVLIPRQKRESSQHLQKLQPIRQPRK